MEIWLFFSFFHGSEPFCSGKCPFQPIISGSFYKQIHKLNARYCQIVTNWQLSRIFCQTSSVRKNTACESRRRVQTNRRPKSIGYALPVRRVGISSFITRIRSRIIVPLKNGGENVAVFPGSRKTTRRTYCLVALVRAEDPSLAVSDLLRCQLLKRGQDVVRHAPIGDSSRKQKCPS